MTCKCVWVSNAEQEQTNVHLNLKPASHKRVSELRRNQNRSRLFNLKLEANRTEPDRYWAFIPCGQWAVWITLCKQMSKGERRLLVPLSISLHKALFYSSLHDRDMFQIESYVSRFLKCKTTTIYPLIGFAGRGSHPMLKILLRTLRQFLVPDFFFRTFLPEVQNWSVH